MIAAGPSRAVPPARVRRAVIRPMRAADASAIVELAVSSGLFPADEVAIVESLLADYLAGAHERGYRCVVDVEPGPRGDAGLVGMAYAEPVRATDGTCELTMIAVDAALQGHGRGTALPRAVEADLAADGQRLLLVQTSGAEQFARTRLFYARNGYEEEARVRDYYSAGDDMLLFRLVLARR